jgi:capsular exopolysaccharide synthesis family protein
VPLWAVEEDSGVGLREYLSLFKRHWLAIALITLLGVVFGGLKAMSESPVYQASVTMLVEPDLSRLASTEGMAWAGAWRFYETQYELLRSRALAERVVDKLGLIHRREQLEAILNWTSPLDEMFDRAKATITGASPKPFPPPDAGTQTVTPGQEQRRRDALASMVQGGVGVVGGDKTQLVRVSFDSRDPELAAEVANTLVDAYIELGLESRLDRAKRVSSWLTERIEGLRRKVLESEEKLHDFQSRTGMIDLDNIEKLTDARLDSLNQQLVNAQKRYAELAKRYGPKHPKLIAAKSEVDTAQRRLGSVSRDVVETRAQEFELSKLEREVASNRQLYEVFLNKFRETDLSADNRLSNARVVDRARVPGSPFKPDRYRIIMFYGSMGLLAALLLVFIREHLDNTFKNNEQLELRLKLPVLGVVPLLEGKRLFGNRGRRAKNSSDGTAVDGPERHFLRESRSGFAEAINHIRTGISFSNVDDPPRIVLITSAVQGEGKTTLATNLAMSYAQLDKTLLIDADLRKPRLRSITPVARSNGGLVDYVAGTQPMQDCIVPDPECSNLYLLQSGTIPPNPLELLSSKKLAGTLEELKGKFSHVIIDTAPILPVSDAIVLGHVVDELLLVIQAERTTHKMVQDAMRRLQAASVLPLGVVLTQVKFRRSTYYYDGKYQYYYGGYYGQESEARKAS